VSKRDEDSAADLEVGMTTAERRRRRRRGGSLRVPSDNVPRTRAPTAPPAPRPEDPALAMSIAYSFSNDASGPVPRSVGEDYESGPIAPEAAPTVIDPPAGSTALNDSVAVDFETQTREMSAVDLEALGLSETAGSTMRMERISSPGLARPPSERASSENDVEISVDTGDEAIESPAPSAMPSVIIDDHAGAGPAAAVRAPQSTRERLQTVALSEDDLEEVRAARAESQSVLHPRPTTPLPVPPHQASEVAVAGSRPKPSVPEPMSSPEIDLAELERVDSSEYEVAVALEEPAVAHRPTPPPPRAPTAPIAPPAENTKPKIVDGHAPPRPPPVTAKAPPAPPAKVEKPKDKGVAKDKPPKGKPWFVDLFDEDYLRTLPFLTPQATQAEAEFVMEAMQLAQGAQVIDIGCGYGRHAMELAARGLHVVGLDLSTPLLVRGGEEAHRRGLTINFIRGDMRELDFENQFDAAYSLFSTFGYFDDETNKKTLQNIARALKPGGKLLIEILNRDYVIADLPTRVWWEGDGCVVLEEVELNYFSSRIQVNRSVVFDDGRQLEQEISVRAYSLHEVGKLMHAAGFRVLEVSGGYQTRGRFFGNQSRHIIVLAERKETP
jgi:SAM-dependent methyltransferase